MVRALAVLVCSIPLAAESLLPVVSAKEGRRYLIDLDKFELQQALEAVSQPAAGPAALSLPNWLPPYPGAIQESDRFPRAHAPPRHKDLNQRYYAPGTPDQIIAHYQAAVVRAGLPAVRPIRTATGVQLHVSHLSEWGVVTAKPRAGGGSDLTIFYTVKNEGTFNSGRKFDAVWYDDNAGILRLRDRASGQEFNLRREAIARFDVSLNRAVQATLDELPAWIPRYPGAAVERRSAAGSHGVPETPSVVTRFRTRDSVDRVWDYYSQALPRAGLTIVGQSRNRSGGVFSDSKIVGANALNQSVEVSISKNLELPGLPVPVRGNSSGIPTMTWKTTRQGGGVSITITFRVHLPKQGKQSR